MCVSLSRVIAGLATAAIIFSAVQPAAAFGLRVGGIGGFRGGFGGAHHRVENFRMGNHFGRFSGQHFGRFFGNGLFGGIYDPYDFGYPSDLGYPSDPPNVASAGAPSAYSGVLTGNYSAPGGDCVLYKLDYDDKGKYQCVTASHPCR
jgi:hypothetical protein